MHTRIYMVFSVIFFVLRLLWQTKLLPKRFLHHFKVLYLDPEIQIQFAAVTRTKSDAWTGPDSITRAESDVRMGFDSVIDSWSNTGVGSDLAIR